MLKHLNYGKRVKHRGIFQFESQGMTNFMNELKPDSLEDIIAGVSLYRPRTNGSNTKIYKRKTKSRTQ